MIKKNDYGCDQKYASVVIYHLYQIEIDFGFDWIWFVIFPVCSFFCILFC